MVEAWQAAKYRSSRGVSFAACWVAAVAGTVYWWMYSGVFSTEDSTPQPGPSRRERGGCCYRGLWPLISASAFWCGHVAGGRRTPAGKPDAIAAAGEYRYALGPAANADEAGRVHLYFDKQGLFQRAAIVRE
jgi:hypothetical protein